MPSPRNLYLYLHTHWDREWYQTHEEYRTRLTFVAADILKKLKTGSMPSFFLDGQSCVLDDIEEVVPDLHASIAEEVTAGRLEIGPWYVLADQMLVSGESLIRNLEVGLDVAAKYGKPSRLGYCPDTFGHSQDLPRLLSNFDIKTAFVWRGVSERSTGPLFWWQSPDGSRVLAYHLARGYYQTAFHDNLTTEKLAEYFLSWGDHSLDSNARFDTTLVPVGADHFSAPPNFNKQLESARLLLKIESMGVAQSKSRAKLTLDCGSLSAFAGRLVQYAEGEGAQIETLASELRDNTAARAHARAFMLDGTLSARLYLKQMNRLSEKRLARVLEPVLTLLNAQKLSAYPGPQLEHAWKELLRNHPHDSICGCSADAVHREMISRFERVHSVLNILERNAFELMARDKESDVEHLFDALASHAKPADKPESPEQKGSSVCNVGYKLTDEEQNSDAPFANVLSSPGVSILPDSDFEPTRLLLANLSGEKNLGPVPISWTEDVDGSTGYTSVFSPNKALTVQVVASRDQSLLFSGSNQIPVVKNVRIFDGFLHIPEMQTFGFTSLPWKTGSGYGVNDEFSQFEKDSGDVTIIDRTISNEFFTLLLDTAGNIIVKMKKAENRQFDLRHFLRDVGDGGDTYNFDPIVQDTPIESRLVSVAPGKSGPLVASLFLTYTMKIPAGLAEDGKAGVLNGKRSTDTLEHTFTTEVLLKKSVPIVFFETSFENFSRNHRLEVVFGTGAQVKTTLSENHFSLFERSHSVEQSPLPVPEDTEALPLRYPCQRFFIASEQVFFNAGLPEYGVDDEQVSLTLLRSISHLSRDQLRTRGGGAGPSLQVDEANCLGAHKVSYAWAPLDSACYGEPSAVEPTTPDKAHEEAQAVLEHLALSASGSAKARVGDAAFKSESAGHNWTRNEEQSVNAYRLAELFEGLHWSCLTRTVPVVSKSHLFIDNAAIRIVALRTLERSSEIEVRLLNVLARPQAASIDVHLAHHDARLTFADGRLIKTLVANGENQPIIRDVVHAATYPIEMEANALVSLRLQYNKG